MTDADADARLQAQVRQLQDEATRHAEAQDARRAVVCLAAAIEAAGRIADPDLRVATQTGVCAFCLQVELVEWASRLLGQVLSAASEALTDESRCRICLQVAALHRAQGHPAEAVEPARSALALAQRSGAETLLRLAWREVGEALAQDAPHEALAAFSQSLALAEADDATTDQLALLASLAACHHRLDDAHAAGDVHRRRVALAATTGDALTIGLALGDLAKGCYRAGQLCAAVDCFLQARRHFATLADPERAVHMAEAAVAEVAALIASSLDAAISAEIAAVTPEIADPSRSWVAGAPAVPAVDALDVLCAAAGVLGEEGPCAERLAPFASRGALAATDDEVCHWVGTHNLAVTGCEGRPPASVAEAARQVVQVRRHLAARSILRELRAGRARPNVSGTGDGGFALYLRSFVADGRLPNYHSPVWGVVDLEELLAAKLAVGPWPLVALGTARADQYGAGKVTTDDAEWQRDLTLLGLNADVLLVVPCATDGTSWEMEWTLINGFLRKTVFVMPPSGTAERAWWQQRWNSLRPWSRYLGLDFPEYDPEGALFRLGPNGLTDCHPLRPVLEAPSLWQALLECLATWMANPEWLDPTLDGLPELLRSKERDTRAVQSGEDRDAVVQQDVESHVERIAARMNSLPLPTPSTVSPYLLGLLERGRPAWADLSNWPLLGQIPAGPGVCTLWNRRERLIWAVATHDLHASVGACADGQPDGSGFSEAFFARCIDPDLDAELRQLVAQDELPRSKLVRVQVRRWCVAKCLPMGFQEAQAFAQALRHGVLDAGVPMLQSAAAT